MKLHNIVKTSREGFLLTKESSNGILNRRFISSSSPEDFLLLVKLYRDLTKYRELFNLPPNTKIYWRWDGGQFIPDGLVNQTGLLELDPFELPPDKLEDSTLFIPRDILYGEVTDIEDNIIEITDNESRIYRFEVKRCLS